MNLYETTNGTIEYECKGEGIIVLSYSGKDIELHMPDRIENVPVTSIGKKAFLGNKYLKKIVLPKDLQQIDDWAFAKCTNLHTVAIPYRQLTMGRGIWKDCKSLKVIANLNEQNDLCEDVGFLLAATVNLLETNYLFDLENAGTVDWIVKWDARLKLQLEMDDTEGFSKMLLCGEEDYGSKENDRDYYMSMMRRNKVNLCLLRLMHPFQLQDTMQQQLTAYLQQHTKGCSTEETWIVAKEEHGDNLAVFRFLIESGCIHKDNMQDILMDLGDQHTEVKGYLMHDQISKLKEEDCFSQFAL